MVSTLALLKYSVIYMNVKQGSGPDRGRSPVEWGGISSVHLSIRPPPRGLSQALGGPSQVLGDPSQTLEVENQALGGPSQALGGPGQPLEGLSQAPGGLSQALGGLC